MTSSRLLPVGTAVERVANPAHPRARWDGLIKIRVSELCAYALADPSFSGC